MRPVYRPVIIITLLILVLFAFSAGGSEALPGDRVDFDMTVQRLYELAQRMPVGPAGDDTIFILDGHVAAISILPGDGPFRSEIELVTGSWQGLRRVTLHRVIVVADEGFESRISARPLPQPDPGMVVSGIEILVAGRITEIRQDSSGRRVPVVQADRIRTRR